MRKRKKGCWGSIRYLEKKKKGTKKGLFADTVGEKRKKKGKGLVAWAWEKGKERNRGEQSPQYTRGRG